MTVQEYRVLIRDAISRDRLRLIEMTIQKDLRDGRIGKSEADMLTVEIEQRWPGVSESRIRHLLVPYRHSTSITIFLALGFLFMLWLQKCG
jgi:hypothetical protein